MRSAGKILTCMVLLLVMMYSGGVGISRCNCTGATALIALDGSDCCPGEECMTVTVMQLTDEYFGVHYDLPVPMPVALHRQLAEEPVKAVAAKRLSVMDSHTPPGRQAATDMVMRV